MCGCPIDGERRSDADADDHESQLVVQRIGQDAAQVVLDHGIEDREGGHRRADVYEKLGSRRARA